MDLLHFAAGGFWLYYRLLEAGTFEELKTAGDSCRLQIDDMQLSVLLSGTSRVASSILWASHQIGNSMLLKPSKR